MISDLESRVNQQTQAAGVYDAGPTLKRNWFNVSWLPGDRHHTHVTKSTRGEILRDAGKSTSHSPRHDEGVTYILCMYISI